MARTSSEQTDVRQLRTTTVTDPATNAAVSTTVLDSFSGVIITTTTTGNPQTLQNPTDTGNIKRFTVINNDTSTDSITVNGKIISIGESKYFIWDGDAWTDETVPLTSAITAPGNELKLDAMLTDGFSGGWIEGMTVNDNGSETITVDAGEVFVRSGATETSPIEYRTTAALTSTAIPTDTTRYVILTYSSGTMTPTLETSDISNGFNILYIAEVHNISGVLDIHNDHRPAGDAVNRLENAWSSILGIRVISGEVASDPTSPSLKLAVSAGSLIDRFLRPITTPAFDSTDPENFQPLLRDGGTGNWTYETPTTDWDDANIDVNGTKTAMTGGTYANKWVIRGINGNIAVQYGQAEFASAALAIAESPPATKPEEYDEHGFYVAQITFLKSAGQPDTITVIKPEIDSVTSISGTSVHNDLTSLQGGQAAEFFHLKSSEYTGTGTGDFVRETSPTLVTPALGTPASGALTNCTFPTLNQNTSGTAANLSGTPTVPDGTAATTQSASDNSTKLATTAYVDAAGGGSAVIQGGYGGGSMSQGATNYHGLGGITIPEGTESKAQIPIARAGTLKNFRVMIGANTLNVAPVVTVRKNGVDTSITLTVTAATTGVFSDLSNTDTVSAGDLMSISVVTPGGTGNVTGWGYSIELE